MAMKFVKFPKDLVEFYDANGFHPVKMSPWGKKHGFSKAMVEDAMLQYFYEIKEEYPKLGRLEHSVRIDIARNIRDICQQLEKKEYVETEKHLDYLKDEVNKFRGRWHDSIIFSTLLLIVIFIIILAENF